MRTIFNIVVLLFLLTFWAARSQNVSELERTLQERARAAEQALVPIVGLGSAGPIVVGTGFFVTEQGYFATAFHVVDRTRSKAQGFGVLLRLSNGTEGIFPFEMVANDVPHDLALCRIVENPHRDSRAQVHPVFRPLRISRDAPAVGTLIAISGFPLATAKPVFHFAIVGSNEGPGDRVQIPIMINEGESGAPVLAVQSGEVIAIIISVRAAELFQGTGHAPGQQNSGLANAAPAAWLRDILDRQRSISKPDSDSIAPFER